MNTICVGNIFLRIILSHRCKSGKFNNLLDVGFQEGYYPTLEEIDELFGGNGFSKDDKYA